MTSPAEDSGSKELRFIDYFATLAKWRNFIIINTFIVMLIVAAYSLMMPKDLRIYHCHCAPGK